MDKTLEEIIKMIIEETAIVKINDTYSVCSDSLSKNITGFLKKHEAKGEFVSVNKSLPELHDGISSDKYLCLIKEGESLYYDVCYLYKFRQFASPKWVANGITLNVTHWQPLPTPPKEV